jgi:secondary thiamine-phosphate synthase enzyme
LTIAGFKFQIADCRLQIDDRRLTDTVKLNRQSSIVNRQSSIVNRQSSICNLKFEICNLQSPGEKMLEKIPLRTAARQELVNITDQVRAIVEKTGVAEGMCYVYCPHSTAGLLINSYLDPMTPKDITHELDRLVPTRVDFQHVYDTPSDAAGHIKATLVGIHQAVMIHEGKLMLGGSQGILFAEFDGPRNREVFVKVVND